MRVTGNSVGAVLHYCLYKTYSLMYKVVSLEGGLQYS
jgi:hypothetical protein